MFLWKQILVWLAPRSFPFCRSNRYTNYKISVIHKKINSADIKNWKIYKKNKCSHQQIHSVQNFESKLCNWCNFKCTWMLHVNTALKTNISLTNMLIYAVLWVAILCACIYAHANTHTNTRTRAPMHAHALSLSLSLNRPKVKYGMGSLHYNYYYYYYVFTINYLFYFAH